MAGNLQPVRVTLTNAGPDSKGMVSIFGWDLEGLVAFYLVAGALAGMLIIFALAGRPLLDRVLLGLLPLGLSALWIKIFIHGKPPAFQRDVFEKWIRGRHFGLRPQPWGRKQPPRSRLRPTPLTNEVSRG